MYNIRKCRQLQRDQLVPVTSDHVYCIRWRRHTHTLAMHV